MRFRRTLAIVGLFASRNAPRALASDAQALLQPNHRGNDRPDYSVPLTEWQSVKGEPPRCQAGDERPITTGQHSLKEQDNAADAVCAAKGDRQWSGTIDVSDERRLFFWFAESRNDPKNDPIIIWMDGGPGASSMLGLFTQIGPCTLQHGKNATKPNKWAWNKKASVLFIDQPAGVGFSAVAPGAPLPSSDIDPAEDFQAFLNIFFTSVFPDKARLPIHVASESYGGHFAPTYLEHILQSRRYGSRTAFSGNITSMILVSPLLDIGATGLGAFELFCHNPHNKGIYDEATCDRVREAYPECWRLRDQCILTQDRKLCAATQEYCMAKIMGPYHGCILDVKAKCDQPIDCDLGFGNISQYMNHPNVLAALGFPRGFNFVFIDQSMWNRYAQDGWHAKPMAPEMRSILEAHKEPGRIGDIRVLILGGERDVTCNVPGTKISLDLLTWSGQADYRMASWAPLPKSIRHAGEWKATRDGRLAFVSLADAGHFVPAYQPEASFRILDEWLQGGWQG